jgi:hypothetical protein
MADAMTTRKYVFLNGSGEVTGDNETSAWPDDWAAFDLLPLPATQINVTDHPDWQGVGSLIRHTRDVATGRFTPPPPQPPVDPLDEPLTPRELRQMMVDIATIRSA